MSNAMSSTSLLFSQLDLKPCRPKGIYKDRHVNTIAAYYSPMPFQIEEGQLWEVPLADGSQLRARFHEGSSEWIIVLMHGLGGSIQSNYMVGVTFKAKNLQHSVLRVNHRNCGEGFGLSNRCYHSGVGDDISDVIRMTRQRHPNKKICLMGFSLGANASLTLLTGQRGTELPDQAFVVNPPINLAKSSLRINSGVGLLYGASFLRELMDEVKKLNEMGVIRLKPNLPPLANLRDFDEAFTAPICGFKNALDYYQQCSTHEHLHKINVPTVILTTEDDPMIDAEDFRSAKVSSQVYINIEKYGGHLGYLCSDLKDHPEIQGRWLLYAIDQFLKYL